MSKASESSITIFNFCFISFNSKSINHLIQQLLFFYIKHSSFLIDRVHSLYLSCNFPFTTVITFCHNSIHFLRPLFPPNSNFFLFHNSTMITGPTLLFNGTLARQVTFNIVSFSLIYVFIQIILIRL